MKNKWKIKLVMSGIDGDSKLNIKLQSTADESSTVQAILQAALQFSIEHNVDFKEQLKITMDTYEQRRIKDALNI
ncbi:MAG: hypothetical protein ACI35S_05445 [Anaeroplasma sp.]